MCPPGEPSVFNRPNITGVIDPLDCLSEDLNLSSLRGIHTDLSEDQGGALRNIGGDPSFFNYRSK
jgi:hypothetical protein